MGLQDGKHLSDWLVKGGATGAGWDSIVHASFQAIPILHMSVGASHPDALTGLTGDRKLRSFYRERVDTDRFLKKRPLVQKIAPSINVSRKKPTLRASKLQIVEDRLTGFDG